MACVNACNDDWHVQVVSRRLVKASDTSIKPHTLAVSNLDRVPRAVQISMVCVYSRPPTTGFDFDAVVATFEAGLPPFLNHFFPLAGRIISTTSSSGVPEIHCHNQGAELVIGHVPGVPLASLDYAAMGAPLRRIQLPYGEDVALSVQVVSFACGGFSVAWRTNHAVADGCALAALVIAWSEFTRSGTGTLPAAARPNHDRSVFRPRAPPCYGAAVDEAFAPLDARRQVNALTADQSSVLRFYHVGAAEVTRLREAASRGRGRHHRATRVEAVSAYLWKALAGVVAGTAEPRCRMGWWVDGRRRLTAPQRLRPAAMHNYFGNVIAFAGGEAGVREVLRAPLPEVAAMVRTAITAPAPYDEHFQELVDWVEEHKTERRILAASIGLGSPTLIVTAFTSFPIDTDFGFGHAAVAVPTTVPTARLCSGFVQIVQRPGGDGSCRGSLVRSCGRSLRRRSSPTSRASSGLSRRSTLACALHKLGAVGLKWLCELML